MDFIKSQDIKEPLTHVLHKRSDYDIIQKKGIKVKILEHPLLWKPDAFWISMDHDWERWCTSEDFIDVSNAIVCDVIIKEDLKLLKITNVDQAEELAIQLMPNYTIPQRFSYHTKLSDMLTLSLYMMDKMKEGIAVGREIWNPISDNFDGIYFRNSGSLHFETFFNAWDAHSIALFDGKNATLSNPRKGKKLVDSKKKEWGFDE